MFRKILPHLAAIGIFLALSIAFFAPQLQGKVISQGDMVQYQSMSREHKLFEKELGEPMLWTNAMFGGMPTYQITTKRNGNLLVQVDKLMNFGFGRPIGLFFVAMLSFYILMISLGVNPWLGMIGAFAFSFTTNNFVLFEAGHVTKIQAIAYLPLIAAGVINAFKGKYWLGATLFALGLGLDIFANHVQMTYYYFLTLLIYGVVRLIYDIREKQVLHFLKASGALIVAGLIAVGSSAVNLMPTYEYAEDTMRGAPILEKEEGAAPTEGIQSSSETEGLSFSYAMNWSNKPIDLFSTYIPRVVGGSSGELVDSESELYRSLRNRGANLPETFPAPTYWGGLPSTSGPNYFGAILVFLFIFGLLVVKGPAKWWLGLGTLLTFLLSMGSYFEGFNRLIFENVPLYNKFRTPNSILSVTAALIPLLAMLAVTYLQKENWDKKKVLSRLYIALGISGLIGLYFAFIGPSSFDFAAANDAYYESRGYDIGALVKDRKSMMRNDALRSLLLVLIAGGLLWAYIQERIKFNIVLIGIGVLTLFDLWSVGRRYISPDDFVTKRNYDNAFTPRPVDQQILSVEKNRGAYRVLDVTASDPWSNAAPSYHHNTVGGYSPVKLQRAQDIIDRHLNLGPELNREVLNMLNTKYVILGQGDQIQVQGNPGLGNAWFIDTLIIVPNANAEIDALKGFDASRQAIVHEEFREYIAGFDPNPNGTITLDIDNYRPDYLIYESNANSDQLAVFSEVWYGPDKGWNAYIDGQPVEYIRVNYILRALKIPAGQHKIEFRFEPATFYTGRTISLVSSSLILLGLLGFIGFHLPKWIQENRAVPTSSAKTEAAAPNTTNLRPKPKRVAEKPKLSNAKPTPTRSSTKKKKKKR